MILCSNPQAQYLAHKGDIDAAVASVLSKGSYILGEEVQAFEQEFAQYIGVAHGIGVSSGTDALQVALRACKIGPGDEVITVAHTAVATVAAIELCGAQPVFVDIERDYYTMDPDTLEKAITKRTKCIVPVHLYGQPADLTPILEIAKRHSIRVIEDCAQAHGALYHNQRIGSFGDLACFSFYPTKNLGAAGDGGMLVTHDDELCRNARALREYGWKERYVSQCAGLNSRLDELQAALLRVKLRFLDGDNANRRSLAQVYARELCDAVVLPKERPDCSHVYHLYVVRTQHRNQVQSAIRRAGIGALVHYPVPVHLQPAYKGRFRASGNLAETTQASEQVLSLPIYPGLTVSEVAYAAKTLKNVLEDVA